MAELLVGESTVRDIAGVKGGGVNLGVLGRTPEDGNGVFGESPAGNGVFGNSEIGRGVVGVTKAGTGVEGNSSEGIGVFGSSEKGRGVVGVAKEATGVEGNSENGAGVFGSSQNGVGVHGKGGRLGGLFEGNVEVTGNLTVSGINVQNLLERIIPLEQKTADTVQLVGRVNSIESKANTLQQQVNNLQQQLASLQQKQAQDVEGIAISLATLAARITAIGG